MSAPDHRLGAARTVLLVDDNVDELVIYSTLLRHAGHAVLAAPDYDSAIELARRGQPDVALIDLNLGAGLRDGCDIIDTLRASPETASIPIIAHTAFTDVYRRRLARAGIHHVIQKPVSPQQLLQFVGRLLPSS